MNEEQIQAILEKLKADSVRTEKTISVLERDTRSAIASQEGAFYAILFASAVDNLDPKDSIENNLFRLTFLESAWRAFFESQYFGFLRDYLANFETVNGIVSRSLGIVGLEEIDIQNAIKALDPKQTILGVKANGTFIDDGFFDSLAKADLVKQAIRQFFTSQIVGGFTFRGLKKALFEIVATNEEGDGLIQKTFDADTLNRYHEIVNGAVAKSVGLEHFIYEGSVIVTTRKFCEKRAGKPFSVAETATWKDDPDLIEKSTKEQYNPILERGRYNCRHFLKYISKEMYEYLKNQQND